MARILEAAKVWRMAVFADVHSFAEHEAVGATAQELRAILRDELARYGSDIDVVGPDVSRRTISSDTLSAVIQLRPSAATSTDSLAQSVLDALNKPSRRSGVAAEEDFDGFVPHTPSAYAALAVLATPVAAPLVFLGTAANYLADGGRAQGLAIPRPFSFVVDESSIAEGQAPAGTVPRATSTFVGSLLSASNTIASADRTRDGRSNGSVGAERVDDAVKQLRADGLPSLGLPSWLGPLLIAVGIGAGVVAVGYAARGVADVLRET